MQIRVRYSVTYECVLDDSNTEPNEIEESIKYQDWKKDYDVTGDILSDIDIPEGGNHNSSYVSETFEVLSAKVEKF